MVPLIKPAAVFFIFFLILNVARSQTPADSTAVISNVQDTAVISATADTTQIIQSIRKTPKPIRDSALVQRVFDSSKIYRTDSIRFSNRKPREFQTFSTGWTEVLKAQP